MKRNAIGMIYDSPRLRVAQSTESLINWADAVPGEGQTLIQGAAPYQFWEFGDRKIWVVYSEEGDAVRFVPPGTPEEFWDNMRGAQDEK